MPHQATIKFTRYDVLVKFVQNLFPPFFPLFVSTEKKSHWFYFYIVKNVSATEKGNSFLYLLKDTHTHTFSPKGELPCSEKDSRRDNSLTTKSLTSSWKGSFIIYSHDPHNLFLETSVSFISRIALIINI